MEHHGDEFDASRWSWRRRPSRCPDVAALAPRLLRVAGELTDGTILWMANATRRSRPTWRRGSQGRRRRRPAGAPDRRRAARRRADDAGEARAVAADQFAGYGELPNYRRILDIGGADGPGRRRHRRRRGVGGRPAQALVDAGATDIWAAPFPVGTTGSASPPDPRPAAVAAADGALSDPLGP